jgi:hypothetical protein
MMPPPPSLLQIILKTTVCGGGQLLLERPFVDGCIRHEGILLHPPLSQNPGPMEAGARALASGAERAGGSDRSDG